MKSAIGVCLVIMIFIVFHMEMQVKAQTLLTPDRINFGTIKQINCDTEITLINDVGREFRLADLYLPSRFVCADIKQDWQGKEVHIQPVSPNRFGQERGYVYGLHAAMTMQEILLRNGLVYVYHLGDKEDLMLLRMQQAEANARQEKIGVWSKSLNPIIPIATLEKESYRLNGKFILFKGIVREVKEIKGMVYLNFGEDWSKDVTIALSVKGQNKQEIFEQLNTYTGRNVLVRGYVRLYRGPFIQIYHLTHVQAAE